MALTKEQISEIKKQILEQTSHLPEEKRKQIKEQLEKMSEEELEIFVQQQMEAQAKQPQKPIFRSVVDGDIHSKKIAETKEAIAVLDIKPISKGHIIIIPKKQVKNIKNLPDSTFLMSKELSSKITEVLKAKETAIQTESKFGEIIINVIPIFDKPLDINSPRHDTSEKDLNDLQKLLTQPEKPKPEKPKKQEIIKMKRRIP